MSLCQGKIALEGNEPESNILRGTLQYNNKSRQIVS